MKRNYFRMAIVLAMAMVAIAGLTIAAGAQMNGKGKMNQAAGVNQVAAVTAITEAEKTSLVYMREEEKLAHDVYTALAAKWDSKIFAQIASSELRHTESIAALLTKYGINDPAAGAKEGVFANTELQSLYNSLVAEGSKSLAAAYAVGATIEDLDIADLDEALTEAKNTDIIRVYGNLKFGSTNHLRAFYSYLKAEGGEYAPKYISAEDFAEITSGPVGQSRMGKIQSKQGKAAGAKGFGWQEKDCDCTNGQTPQGGSMMRNGK